MHSGTTVRLTGTVRCTLVEEKRKRADSSRWSILLYMDAAVSSVRPLIPLAFPAGLSHLLEHITPYNQNCL